jgi:hypothetical protein
MWWRRYHKLEVVEEVLIVSTEQPILVVVQEPMEQMVVQV